MIRTVSEYLKESARLFPENTALADSKRSITYEAFLQEAEILAWQLTKRGLFKKPVAVFMDKGTDAVIAFLAVAMSGNYYTVIDTKMPEARSEKIFQTFQPEILLTDSKNRKKADKLAICKDIERIVYEEAQTENEINRELLRRTEKKIIDTDILYVLFTSGSTGTPKGVIISHRSVVDYTEWVSETFHFDSETIIGNQAPFYFDNSVLDIYASLRNGASLHIIPQMMYSFPIRLLEYIRDHHINTVFWVPTVLSRIADLDILEDCGIDCLKRILFAGEVMPAKQLNIWMRRLPEAVFANLYGPTEITVDCTYYIVDRKIEDHESVPIGHACRNSDILVLNEKNQPAETGEKGELCVRGSSLALGYYNNPEKTREAFVQNPLNTLYEEKIYRTGDIVHYNQRGELIYDGRMDTQIKHTGHRIELGEIETAVSAIPGVAMNCCLHCPQSDQLVLFYTGDIASDEIRGRLYAFLPEYMLPNQCRKLPQMPLNMNGKIDRVKLKQDMGALMGN